jgi:hypothetical protein
MGMRLSPLVLMGFCGRLGLCGVLPYGKLLLLGSGRFFRMLVGLRFIMSFLAAMFVAVGSVLVRISPMLMGLFLVAII